MPPWLPNQNRLDPTTPGSVAKSSPFFLCAGMGAWSVAGAPENGGDRFRRRSCPASAAQFLDELLMNFWLEKKIVTGLATQLQPPITVTTAKSRSVVVVEPHTWSGHILVERHGKSQVCS